MTDAEFGDPRLPQRFWDKVRVNEETGCWEWTAAQDWCGYGWFGYDGRSRKAHRVAYAALVGDLPEWTPTGLQIDHLCRIRACVNPAHLELVSHRVNTLRGDTITAEQSRRTHCPRGHALDGANIRSSAGRGSWRQCLTCHRANSATGRALFRAAHVALGITRREYHATFGYSRAAAELVLASIGDGDERAA